MRRDFDRHQEAASAKGSLGARIVTPFRFETFSRRRAIALARGKSSPSSCSKSSSEAKNMNPPGTRTAIPTTRRSNSTAKRCVVTTRLLTSDPMRAWSQRQAQLKAACLLKVQEKRPLVSEARFMWRKAPGAARLAGGRQGPTVVRCCSRGGAATVQTENAQSYLRYGSPGSRIKEGRQR